VTSPRQAREAIIEALGDLLARPEEEIDLPSAALVLARVEYTDLDVAEARKCLRALTREAAEKTAALPKASLEDVRRIVFDEMGFRGNRSDYYDPRNSFLNDVIDRRVGIPISLSVVYIEIAAACGRPTEAVGFPGHFLVRDCESGTVIDPFHRGAVVDEHACRRLLAAAGIPLTRWRDEYLDAVGKLDILVRMIANLMRVYKERGDAGRVSLLAGMSARIEELRAADDASPLQ
jgi:regulator of sirC expression with transglutaminase-like and TPR domain